MSDKEKKAKVHKQGFLKATSIMAAFSLLASGLGFVKNITLTSIFGMGAELDSYYAAFRIPDFIYMILVGGALSSAFIPIFSVYIATKEEEKGYKMASTILNLVIIFALGLCVVGEVFTPQLIRLTTKLTGDKFLLTVKLTRIMFFQSFFMCITGVAMGICMSYSNFVPTSVGSVFYNLAIIVFGLLFSQVFGLGIAGFSISVVVGALANFLVHVKPIRDTGFKYYPEVDIHNEGVGKFFKLFWPMLLGISVTQINLLVNQYFASGLKDSIISAMSNAQTIMEMPINLFGGTISLSIFPTMSEHFATGRMDEYKKDLSLSMRTMLFVTIPSMAGLIVIRTPLIRAMFYQGNFTEGDIDTVATLLMFYSIGIIGYCCRQVLARGFYSAQDTRTPVRINITILTLNIVLSIIFVKFWKENGLALAYSTAGLASMTLHLIFLRRKLGTMRGREMIVSAVKSVVSSGVMFAVLYFLRDFLMDVLPPDRKLIQIAHALILIVVGVIVYFVMALVLRMQEVAPVLGILKRKFGRNKGADVTAETTDAEDAADVADKSDAEADDAGDADTAADVTDAVDESADAIDK
ncbi:MAG: murein biosynthesis integral membrane protein MurJ [Eubacterium sp.]|nr:murein biosynthesis integral membrane protein MurJ [Eubacterium sp.]